jgi:hypothetical protein
LLEAQDRDVEDSADDTAGRGADDARERLTDSGRPRR